MQVQNFHTHTRFSDGHDTPREMIEAALAAGFTALGFSDHSLYRWSDGIGQYSLTRSGTFRCWREIRELSRDYAGRIRLYNGVELDGMSSPAPIDYDFTVSSVHEMRRRSVSIMIDDDAETQRKLVDELYAGDWCSFAEAYYDSLTEHIIRQKTDIVGHIDLPTKYSLMPEEEPRYRDAATAAVREIVKHCDLFELNTGVIARGYRTTPYPAPFLLDEIRAAGGRIIVNSDCHDRHKLTCGFDDAEALLIRHGYTRDDHARMNDRVDDITIWS